MTQKQLLRKNLFQCWMSDNEYSTLRAIAGQEEITLSEVVRKLVKAEGKRAKYRPVQSPADVPAQVRQ